MIQKINYFDLFRLKPEFKIDISTLQKNYHELCKDLHPDRINNINRNGLVHTVGNKKFDSQPVPFETITEGYHTLKDDLKRAEHLMDIKGRGKNCKLGPAFLEKIMEIENKKEDESVISYCKNKIEKYKKRFANSSDMDQKGNKNSNGEYADPNLKILQKWRYFDRIINGWEH